MRDGLHQMGLPEPGFAVNEERVVGLPRLGGNRDCCGMGQLIARPDDEVVKGVTRVEEDLALPRILLLTMLVAVDAAALEGRGGNREAVGRGRLGGRGRFRRLGNRHLENHVHHPLGQSAGPLADQVGIIVFDKDRGKGGRGLDDQGVLPIGGEP